MPREPADDDARVRLRYYYYGNKGDPLEVSGGQYAWRTKFHSLSLLYRPLKNWRVISQYLTGSTLMGPNAVHLDYEAYFILVSYKVRRHRFTGRIDGFSTSNKNDILPLDNNSGNGSAMTLGWRFNMDRVWQLGAEWVGIRSSRASREQLGENSKLNQSQFRVLLQYQYH